MKNPTAGVTIGSHGDSVRRRRNAWALALAGIAVAGALDAQPPEAQPSAAQPPAETLSAETLAAEVDFYLEPYLLTGNFSGSVLIGREGEVLLSKGYGQADRESGRRNAPDTVYHLASVSRVFTSVAAMVLVQQGRLSLEAPLSTYLPEWPRGDEITVHHLLSLSAGFPNINTLAGYVLWQQSEQTPASLVEKFRDLPLEYEPGARTAHSNSNYNVLALLIEQVSGKSYSEFLSAALVTPAGMAQTAHHGNADMGIAKGAVGYAPSGLGELIAAPVINWSVKTGNGSVYSTTEDLYRFDRALVEGSLLGEAATEALFTEHFPKNGYGWFVGERFDQREVYINGSSPGFGSYWGRAVEPDVTVIVLGNMYNTVPGTIGRDLLALAQGEGVEPSPLRSEAPDPKVLEAAVGSYRFGPDFYRPNGTVAIRAREGHLFNGAYWLMPTQTGPWKFVHRRYWSDLEFRRDAEGRVVELIYDGFVGKKR